MQLINANLDFGDLTEDSSEIVRKMKRKLQQLYDYHGKLIRE